MEDLRQNMKNLKSTRRRRALGASLDAVLAQFPSEDNVRRAVAVHVSTILWKETYVLIPDLCALAPTTLHAPLLFFDYKCMFCLIFDVGKRAYIYGV